MSKTIAQASADYRARRAKRIGRLEAGYRSILTELAGNDKPVAVRIRAISTEALGEAK
jgi:hypothetical protein